MIKIPYTCIILQEIKNLQISKLATHNKQFNIEGKIEKFEPSE